MRDILHVLGTAQPEGTGIARIVAALAAGLDRRQYRLHAWFLGPGGALARELEAAGATVRVVGWTGGKRDPVGAWRFWKALRTHDFALVHQHAGGRSLRSLVHLASRAPIVVHAHGRISESLPEDPRPMQFRGADAVIAASRAVAERIGIAKGLQVVHAGVGTCEEPGERMLRATTVVGTACRLVPLKGLAHLIDAMALLRGDLPALRLEIAGSGPQRAALEAQVRRAGLDDRVTFLGWQGDLARVFPRWDIFCLPSLEEAFGIAALEAMAAGLPVVASAVGGLPELVDHDRTGHLVPAGNAASLARSLRQLAEDPALRAAMGAAGRRRARDLFSSERMVADISCIYERLAAA